MAAKKTTARDPVESTWAGQAKYSCPMCAFDSLDLSRVREHIEQLHPIPAPPVVKTAAPATTETVTPVTETPVEDRTNG